MNLKLKLKSGALQFTVFVAVLIALLLGALLLYAYTFIYMKEQSKGAIENIQLSNSGINYLLKQQELNTDTIAIDVIKKENQIVKVNLSQWGLFEKATVVTQFRKKKFTKTAIIGSTINAKESPTLILQETQTPLAVVGNTAIRGNIFLPKQGVKSGYIAGNSYYGSQLTYGIVKNSPPKLPALKKSSIDAIIFYLNEYKPTAAEDYINLGINRNSTNSFKTHSKSNYSKGPIFLDNLKLTGNIIIKSDTLIKISKATLLKDIIIIAPIIEIEDGTIGSFQAIASKRISVGKNCNLNYPSALVLYQDTKKNPVEVSTNTFDNKIFIRSGTNFKGSICYYKTDDLANFLTQIVVEENAKIKGQVYCNANFELKGKVSGSVYTKQFVANQSGSIFVNHIYNGTIENENIPNIIGGILLEQEPKTVMKWLY
ncbi:hypothetical protein [Flavobacterium hydatis]|uniref:Uncharacterized protein n=1 Tax=Flavobacterium hydatis TaxID=991 RepID=A0A086A5N1_FLAHY|nr:hypothetical protein [Flavobacterium hydatis]KFF11995.1 hypothetical protein IW20_18710 [Flavobacterium hydatis]OXA94257.1 hypothetical protein B0A62_11410 [Flavobacterium hydatis]